MHDTSGDTLLERLTRLERACRWWQIIAGTMVVLFAIVGLMGAVGRQTVDGTDEVRARAFVLVDRDGKPRMDLRVARNDSTHLVLLDREGLPRMSLNILTQGGADIVIRDQQSLPRVALSVVPDGRPGLSMYDAEGTARVSLGLLPDGQTRLVLYDQGGRLRWVTP
jgi:hypothetical protein